MLSATDAYRNAVRDMDRSLQTVAKSPQVARESAYYLENITKVKSIDDFMNNKRLLQYAMVAHGLGDLSYAHGLIRRVLEGGIDSEQALANRFSDQRYRDFVTTFNFVRYGGTAMAFDRAQKGTVDLYKRQMLEENTGELNEGARLALYFQRKAGSITSPLGILADAALLKVVQTGLNLSPYMSTLSLDSQVEMISKRLDVADFKDSTKLSKFLNRFTAMWDANNSPVTSSNSVIPSLGASTSGFSPDLITAIQRLKSKA